MQPSLGSHFPHRFSEDNSIHKSSSQRAGADGKLMPLHFKTMVVPYEGVHDVITPAADKSGCRTDEGGVPSAQRRPANGTTRQGQLNQSPGTPDVGRCGLSSG